MEELDNFKLERWPVLKGKLWHCTGLEGLTGIHEDGEIKPGHLVGFSKAWPQYENNSYANHMKAVSVFDFGLVEEEDALQTEWSYFFFYNEPVTVAIQLDRDILSQDLIPNYWSQGLDIIARNGEFQSVPHVEAWYPKPIPLEAFKGYIVICSDVFELIHEYGDVLSEIDRVAAKFQTENTDKSEATLYREFLERLDDP